MFLVGAVPALLVIATGKYLREPERWLARRQKGNCRREASSGPIAGLLADRRWRKNLIIGALIASTGVVGLWAIGEYAVDLQRNVFKTYLHRTCAVAAVAGGIEHRKSPMRFHWRTS